MSEELLKRKDFKRRSPSVEKFRLCVRKQYKEKLKESRNNELCQRRNLFRNTLSSIQEMMSPDEQSIVQQEFLQTDEILILFEEVENELKDKDSLLEAEQYNLYIENETNAILDSLLDKCNVCDNLFTNQNNNNTICTNCVNNYFKNEHFN